MKESALKPRHCRPRNLDLLRRLSLLPCLQELSLHLSSFTQFPNPRSDQSQEAAYPCHAAKNALLSKLTLGSRLAQRLWVLLLKGNYSVVLNLLHSLPEVPKLPALVHFSMDLSTCYKLKLSPARFSEFLNHLTSTVQTLELLGSLHHDYCWKSFSSIPTFPYLRALRISFDKPGSMAFRQFFPATSDTCPKA